MAASLGEHTWFLLLKLLLLLHSSMVSPLCLTQMKTCPSTDKKYSFYHEEAEPVHLTNNQLIFAHHYAKKLFSHLLVSGIRVYEPSLGEMIILLLSSLSHLFLVSLKEKSTVNQTIALLFQVTKGC